MPGNSLLKQLAIPPSTLEDGVIDVGRWRFVWNADALRILEGDRQLGVDESAPVTIQLSRWYRPHEASLWTTLVGGSGSHELYVELRRQSLRIRLCAEDCDPAHLEGLPWLELGEATVVSKRHLGKLLKAAAAHGARVASVPNDVAAIPAPTMPRPLTWDRTLGVLMGHSLGGIAAGFLFFGTLYVLGAQELDPAAIGMLLVGVFFLLFALAKGVRMLRLVRYGELVEARRIGVETVDDDDVVIHDVHFEFTARDGRTYVTTGRVTDTEPLTDDATELVLYDPNNPNDACLVDTMPNAISFDADGKLL